MIGFKMPTPKAKEILYGIYAIKLSRSFEDSSFEAADSPVTLNVRKALGRNSKDGYIINDGDGNFTIKHSPDGKHWSDTSTLKKNEVYNLGKIDIHSIILTRVADSAYRVMVI